MAVYIDVIPRLVGVDDLVAEIEFMIQDQVLGTIKACLQEDVEADEDG